jgi:UDP-glucuronate 4-epimerase
MRDFVTIIEQLVGKQATIVDAPLPISEAPVIYADVSKAQRLLGYEPHVSVSDGMAQLWNWYQQELGELRR